MDYVDTGHSPPQAVGGLNEYSSLPVRAIGQGLSLDDPVLFNTPPTDKGTVIRVHLSCSQGLCDCEHFIGGVRAQLLPCRFAAHMFREGHKSRGKDWELFQGVTEGFDIVDHPVDGYDCANYGSITSRPAREVMDISIKEELCEGRVSPVDTKPTCMHADLTTLTSSQNSSMRSLLERMV